jgi:hypothetical protein
MTRSRAELACDIQIAARRRTRNVMPSRPSLDSKRRVCCMRSIADGFKNFLASLIRLF